MADSYTHKFLTGQACKICDLRCSPLLVEEYCCYPDWYCGEKRHQVAPYIFLEDGVDFHGVPPLPIAPLYQNWVPDESGGGLRRLQPYANPNYLFCEGCFHFYFSAIRREIANYRQEEALKFTGCLVHYLQDATFGIHVLEGAAGMDAYALSRFAGNEDLTQFVCALHPNENWLPLTLKPLFLGATAAEAALNLYAKYAECNRKSLQALFALSANHLLCKDCGTHEKFLQEMHFSALEVTAHILYTLRCWMDGASPKSEEELPLGQLEPYESPLGGMGEYRFSGLKKEGNALRFGVHYQQNLLYRLPSGLYQDFTAELQLIKGGDHPKVTVEVVNSHSAIQRFTIDDNGIYPLTISAPSGIVGLRTSATHPVGAVVLHNPILRRKLSTVNANLATVDESLPR